MKRILVLAALATLVSVSSFAAITGTKHDLSNSGPAKFATDATEICVFCHTPHGATTSTNYVPLWNRTASVAPSGFYNSVTIQHTVSAAATASTDAYLCLSCHDGTTLLESLNNPPNTGLADTPGAISGTANLGTDMTNDHPIGFVYNAATDNELKVTTLPMFSGGEMWCSTCHDVHGGVAGTPFLQVNNAGSNLCKSCHNK